MLNRNAMLQERVGSNYVVTDKGDYVGTIPEQDWRDEMVKRWNSYGAEEDALVYDLLKKIDKLEQQFYLSEVAVSEKDLLTVINRKGVGKVLELLLEHRERLMTGEEDDSRLDDAIRILGGIV
jgi:hypothetical protein